MDKRATIPLVLASLLLFGCAIQQPPGSDRDSHGCIASAGYTWCEEKGKCLRAWEENCTAALILSSAPALRIVTEEFPPFNYKDSSGAVSGQSTGLVREIMARTGQKGEIGLMGWADAYAIALRGPNVMIYSTDRKIERDEFFKWAGPIGSWEYDFYALARLNLSLPNITSAKNAGEICVVQDDSRHQFLLENGFSNIKTAADDVECARLLSAGKAILWLGSSTSFAGIVSKANLSSEEFAPLLAVNRNEVYFAFSKDVSDEVVSAWQQALDALKADGTFAAIAEKYAPPSGPAVGNDSDSHGCIASAGYSWCPEKGKCLRMWEEGCPSLEAKALEEQAKSYCGNGTKVYLCGQYIRAVSSMPGAGSSFYTLGNYEPVRCPIVAPEYTTPECNQLLHGNNCIEREIC